MKKLIFAANAYIQQSDWRMLALVKCCLCAVGVVLGLLVPSKAKKAVLGVSLAVFAVTYIPLMAAFLPKAVSSLLDEYVL